MEGATGEERLQAFGLLTVEEGGAVIVDGTEYNSPASEAGFDFDQTITAVGVPTDQPPKELMWIPALLLPGLTDWAQRRRARHVAARVLAWARPTGGGARRFRRARSGLVGDGSCRDRSDRTGEILG